jgi:hypothetical protein
MATDITAVGTFCALCLQQLGKARRALKESLNMSRKQQFKSLQFSE